MPIIPHWNVSVSSDIFRVQGEAKLSEESQPKVEPTTTSPASVYQNPLAMLTKVNYKYLYFSKST